MKQKIFLIYLVVLAFGIFLFLSGYSFSLEFLNYLLVSILIAYPIVQFYRPSLGVLVKIIASFLTLIIVGIVAYYLLHLLAFASGDVTVIKKWRTGGYIITLTKRIDWAGPPYCRYDLSRARFFGLIHKNIDYAYLGSELGSMCKVRFHERPTYKEAVIEFDKCANTIRRLDRTTLQLTYRQ